MGYWSFIVKGEEMTSGDESIVVCELYDAGQLQKEFREYMAKGYTQMDLIDVLVDYGGDVRSWWESRECDFIVDMADNLIEGESVMIGQNRVEWHDGEEPE